MSLQEQRELGKIKNRDEHEEADEEGSSDVLNNGLGLCRKRFATQLFNAEEHEQATVGNRKRKQVHNAQVNADEGKEHQKVLEATHPHVAHHGDNRDRARESVHLDMALEHTLEIAENTRSHFPAGGAGFYKSFDRTATN